jgi:hypothetical protein
VTPLVQTASRLRDAFMSCHAEGHQWRHEGRIGGSDPGANPPFGAFDAVGRVSVCTSCGSERVRWYTRSAEAINRYKYADGYTHKKLRDDDDPAPTRFDWRKMMVRQLFDDLGKPQRNSRKSAAS